jgi:hypothetical protein
VIPQTNNNNIDLINPYNPGGDKYRASLKAKKKWTKSLIDMEEVFVNNRKFDPESSKIAKIRNFTFMKKNFIQGGILVSSHGHVILTMDYHLLRN